MSLKTYKKKRDFRKTSEPAGRQHRAKRDDLLYVVQKHDASRLHYDFRLELGGTLKSWAVPKGPSVNPDSKRLAVLVEDHPIEYGSFEGTIPEGQYGGGTVMVWDRGTWQPHGDAEEDFRKGKLSFDLDGEKLHGAWTLVRMTGQRGDNGKNWLLIKSNDRHASDKAAADPLRKQPDSAATGRSLEEIRASDGEGATPRKKSGNKRGKASSKRATLARELGGEGDKRADIIPLDELAHVNGAKKGSPPTALRPQLATLTRDVPNDDRWLYEIKFDGYRILAVRHLEKWTLITRNGKDWTDRFPAVADAVKKVPIDEGVLDGEVVVLKDNGVSDFQALQNALRRDQRSRMYFYVFDLPYCNGYDLTGATQLDRKRVLRGLLTDLGRGTSHVRFSDYTQGGGPELLRHACQFALEGLIAKRVDAHYVPKRSKTWLKIKCGNRQEFVIVGFTDPKGSRKGLGALLVGVYEGRKLRYSGKVGTGFDQATLKDLHQRLVRIEVKEPHVEEVPRSDARGAHWVKPEFVAEIEFSEWTSDDRLRHPVYHGLREDKPPEKIRREAPSTSDSKGHASRSTSKRPSKNGGTGPTRRAARPEDVTIAGVPLSNPDKVLYPEQKLTKRDLAEYYAQIADWVLPWVVERPLSILRCPSGHQSKCFYQKHLTESVGPAIHGVSIREKQGKAEYLYIKDLAGLIALVQLGVLEMHPWGSRIDRYDRPDRMVFDLDPDPSVSFSDTMAAARELRDRLTDYELQSFLKSTGGKGLHVVVPLMRRNTWDEVRTFSEAVARAIVKADPDRYVANMRKEKRKNRVFVDYLRNSQGATSVASYSTRARTGAPVATPLRWDELTSDLTPNGYTIANIPQRLSSLKADPWHGFDDVRQSITKSMLNSAK